VKFALGVSRTPEVLCDHSTLCKFRAKALAHDAGRTLLRETFEEASGAGLLSDAADERTQYAVIALLEIVGEAAGKVSAPVRATYPDVAWRSLVGMRNHLIHGYNAVDLGVVWTAVTREVPSWTVALERVLAAWTAPEPPTPSSGGSL
jgi:uncharacterized protein with HEPN domain